MISRIAAPALTILGLAGVLAPTDAVAQSGEPEQPWVFATRILMTGSSDHSDPPGYQIYSAFTLEAALSVPT